MIRFSIVTLLFSSLLLTISCQTKTDKNVSKNQYDIDTIPKSIHQLHEEEFVHFNVKDESTWDSIHQIKTTEKPSPNHKLDKDYKTFGWHLFSHGTAYKSYNFALLWGISYFSYQLDCNTGSYKNIHAWKTTELVNHAQNEGCKVFLTVTNFGANNNHTFLSNQEAWRTLSDSLNTLLKLRNANGINIDFEGIAKQDKENFNLFVCQLSKTLKSYNPNYQVSLCLYAVDYNDIFNIDSLNLYVDFYTLMAYDYYGSFSNNAGPITPYKSSPIFGQACLQNSVSFYLNKGVKPSNLIVGLPYYGGVWNTKTQNLPAKSNKFSHHPSYRIIKHNYIDSLKIKPVFDSTFAYTYLNFTYQDTILQQVWFDDINSLRIKYKWLKDQEIGGIGIWALGYDNGFTELWELLAEEFGHDTCK